MTGAEGAADAPWRREPLPVIEVAGTCTAMGVRRERAAKALTDAANTYTWYALA
ncbi:MAG: hypothetical protein H0U69_01210 [Trueperaceae bacterium]|nr:hypothetical protein [Trueperaceae bacterium]